MRRGHEEGRKSIKLGVYSGDRNGSRCELVWMMCSCRDDGASVEMRLSLVRNYVVNIVATFC